MCIALSSPRQPQNAKRPFILQQQGYLAHKKQRPPRTLRRTMPWALWWSYGGGLFCMSECTLQRECSKMYKWTMLTLANTCDGGGRHASVPNIVEIIPTLGALPPRGRPVQDPVFTVSRHAEPDYMGTSLTRKRLPLGPYSRPTGLTRN